MNLNSTARLRIATIAITTFLTAGIGILAAISTFESDRREVDYGITGAVSAAQKNPGEELSASLFFLDEYSLDLSLLLISRDGDKTIINESTKDSPEKISLADARSSTFAVTQSSENQHFRYKSLEISGGDYLVISGSTRLADQRLSANLLRVALLTVIANLLAFIVLSFYIRRLKSRDDYEALARMQEFLGDASHELRTPLTVVKGYVELLSKGQIVDQEGQVRAFNRVNSEISRMENLIHDLLLLAELGESAARDSELIDLSAILKAHSDDFALLHPQREVTLNIESAIYIRAIDDYISRFILNALGNIERHTPERAPVAVSLTANQKTVTVTIEDGGPGLPASAYEEKVRSLHRFDKSRTRENGGSGLGMSIMDGVIRKSGGEFTLKPSQLGGVAVIALLPRHNSPNEIE